MISATIKKVVGFRNINDAKRIIDNHGVQHRIVNDADWPVNDVLRRNISVAVVPELINTATSLDGSQVPFFYACAHSEKEIRKAFWYEEDQLRPREERISTVKSDAVFFQYRDEVFVVFLTHTEKTMSRLKQELLIEQYWGEIESAVDFTVNDDFLYWLLYRRMEHQGVICQNLEVTRISAYIGLATEETQKVSGEGDKIYELLGTMAFLFDNEPLDSLLVDIRYGTENCSFKIHRSGQVKIIDLAYFGNYCGNHTGRARNARLCILIYTVIIPALLNEYELHKQNTQWSTNQRLKFVNNTGMEIIRRVLPTLGLPEGLTIKELLLIQNS